MQHEQEELYVGREVTKETITKSFSNKSEIIVRKKKIVQSHEDSEEKLSEKIIHIQKLFSIWIISLSYIVW